MQESDKEDISDVLDIAQLNRIEAVHKGFLYQHLYAVGCLLLAQAAGVETVTVERDEDIELITEHGRIYVQVKTRSKGIKPSDISDALERFEYLSREHKEGVRKGEASLAIVANQAPSIKLQQNIDDGMLSSNVNFICPQSSSHSHRALPPAWRSLSDAAAWCIDQAERLNFSLLSPDSLVWKLAGLVQLAATGSPTNRQHAFHVRDLPELFEQLIVQLQEFPAPPAFYRPQKLEPSFSSNERVRIICGLSGAGKTAWAAQAALHSPQACAYYDTGDLPGAALASTLVRELAARFATSDRDGLRKILLPGASGYEALRTFDTFLDHQGASLLLVLDNAHRIPVENMRDTLNATKCIRFILLCQPHDNVRALEAITGLQREALLGWDIDTVAAAVADIGGFASPQGYEQLRTYTGGLPMYVESAAKVAVAEYNSDIDVLCNDLKNQENITETPQEVILSRVYQGFEKSVQDSLAVFSLADVGLSSDEISELLVESLNVSSRGAATLLKKMRSTGIIEIFGSQTLKVHDAVRALGLQHLEVMDSAIANNALKVLQKLLIASLHKTRDTSRFALLTQVLIKLNDAMTLIAISGEELFYEMGINVNIMASLERASVSDTLEPVHKFWALDGLAFDEIRNGLNDKLPQRFEAMEALIAQHELGFREQIALAMKRILFFAENGDLNEVKRIAEHARPKLPHSDYERIFNYNYAIALQRLGKHKDAELICIDVVNSYYKVLGISPEDVVGKNADALWTIINHPEDVQDYLKHLADALELYAIVRDAQGKQNPFLRIHSMKFYSMTQASDSLVRVGQDLADEFVGRKDYVGAKQVMEDHVLPVVIADGLLNRLVQVRSQYAVILALVGQHSDAKAELKRLDPYLDGLSGKQLQEVQAQSDYIAFLSDQTSKSVNRQMLGAVKRNDRCPCGSGRKYKKCHGT